MFIFPTLLFFFLISIFIVKKLKFNHFFILIILLVVLVVICSTFSQYYIQPINSYFIKWSGFFNKITTSSFRGLLLYYFTFPFHQSLLGNIFYFHIALIIAFIFEQIEKNQLSIKSLPDVIKEKNLKYPQKEDKKMKQNIEDKTIIGFKNKNIIATDDNARHIFVCGTTGSGKTVMLANYIESAIVHNYPMLIIDGKGDIGNGSIIEITNKFRGDRKVYTVNMTEIYKSSSYNPFQNATSTIVKDMLTNLTEWSEEHYKSNTERFIQRLVYLMELNNINISFTTLLKYFTVEAVTELSKEAVKQNLISKEDHLQTLEIIKASGTIALNASARFLSIAESELGKIFSNNGIDIQTAISENAIILFILNPLIYPETTSLLGRLILIDAKKAVSKLYTERKKRVFFLFDEINSYASPVFIDLLNKSRSANVTCISATQSLSDLDFVAGEAFREQIIENCNNYILLRQNSAKNAEEWANIFGTVEGLSVTYQLGKDKNITTPTGMGSAKKERKYIYHPDDIKRLKTGEAIYMSKDKNEHYKIQVRKGF